VYPNLTLGNSGRFTHRGVEAAAAWQPLPKLGLEATYTALDPGDQTMANPEHKLWLSVRTRFGPVSAAAGVQYVSGLHGKDFGQSPLPEYLLVNARVNVGIVSRLAAFLSVDNILDRRYEILAGYPMPGTTLMMGLNWRDE